MTSRVVLLSLVAAFTVGCQTITQRDTPNLYQVKELIAESVAQTCRSTGSGIVSKANLPEVFSIQRDTAGSSWVKARLKDTLQRIEGRAFLNLSNGSIRCTGVASSAPQGISVTSWVDMTEADAQALMRGRPLAAFSSQAPKAVEITRQPNIKNAKLSSVDSLSGDWRVLETCQLPDGVRYFRGQATLTTPYFEGATKIYQTLFVSDSGDRWEGATSEKASSIIIELDPQPTNREQVPFLLNASINKSRNEISATRGANCELTAIRR